MGTIVSAGDGLGVVYATGANTEFGRIAAGLGERQPETEFQAGLRRFSYLLLWVAMILTVLILVTNLLLRRSVIESVLFALAIAVGITPQLLPAVVSTSLATGSRRLARLNVLVKRLVCIEDLGDIDILITDKTGTLTEGRISLLDAVDPTGAHDDAVLRVSLLATDVDAASGGVSANAMDAALWESPAVERLTTAIVHRVATLPFDHARRATSALLDDDGHRFLVVKGAPEQVMAKCCGARRRAADAGRAVHERPPGCGGGQQTRTRPGRPYRRRRMRPCARRLPGIRRRTEGGGAGFPGTTGGTGHRA
jgi:P-type Mg2+ transporter